MNENASQPTEQDVAERAWNTFAAQLDRAGADPQTLEAVRKSLAEGERGWRLVQYDVPSTPGSSAYENTLSRTQLVLLKPGEEPPKGARVFPANPEGGTGELAEVYGRLFEHYKQSILAPPEGALPRVFYRGDSPHPQIGFPDDGSEREAMGARLAEAMQQLPGVPAEAVESARRAVAEGSQRRLEELRLTRTIVQGPTGEGREPYFGVIPWPGTVPDGAKVRTCAQLLADVELRHEALTRYGEAYVTEVWDPQSDHNGRWA